MSRQEYAIILCGGSGSRLWPLSRKNKPKQFISIKGTDSFLQKTYQRLLGYYKEENIFIVTNELYKFEVIGQLFHLHKDIQQKVICEPESKNTLPAICLATRAIYDNDENAIIGVFSSDHEISNDDVFYECIKQAFDYAIDDKIVLFGINASSANTGYGYIETGPKLDDNSDKLGFAVKQFYEKPNKLQAEDFKAKGFLWNSGMFIFNAANLINITKKYQPLIYSIFFSPKSKIDDESFAKLPNISIDYGLLEKTENIVVIKSSIIWSDLGTWNSLHDFLAGSEDNENNFFLGDVLTKDVRNSLIISSNNQVVAMGLKDIIIANDHDALFICSKDKADDVKVILKDFKGDNKKILEEHPFSTRPWGSYTVLHEGKNFKIKSIFVNPNQQLSLQLHHYRNEHWIVIDGNATITKNEDTFVLNQNESTYIKANEKHRLANHTNKILHVIEISIGSIVDETDIVRFEDNYGRSK